MYIPDSDGWMSERWILPSAGGCRVRCLSSYGDLDSMAGFHNLPRELHDIIFVNFNCEDLSKLGRTSKLIHGLIVPRLYRKISTTDYSHILSLLGTIEKSAQLASFVVYLKLHCGPESTKALATLATRLCTILPRLFNLTNLTISKALRNIAWIYDHLVLPSLREFCVYTTVCTRFLQRHPHLREVTIMGLTGHKEATAAANLFEPRLIRLLNGTSEQLADICSDGHARSTLRRIDWSRNPSPPHVRPGAAPPSPSNDYKIHRIASSVTQVNYLNGHYYLSPPLNPPWTSVKRVGIRVTHWGQWPLRLQGNPSTELNDAATSFPNMETLDVVIGRGAQFMATEKRILEVWEQMQEGLLCFPGLRRVTFCGRNWTRETSASKFREIACNLNDIPDLSTEFP